MSVQRFYLLLELCILVLCISNSTSVAPGDFDEECLDVITRELVSPNEKVLLDTQNYRSQNLITTDGESNIWKSIDFDGIDNGGTYNQVSCKILIQPQVNIIKYIYIYNIYIYLYIYIYIYT